MNEIYGHVQVAHNVHACCCSQPCLGHRVALPPLHCTAGSSSPAVHVHPRARPHSTMHIWVPHAYACSTAPLLTSTSTQCSAAHTTISVHAAQLHLHRSSRTWSSSQAIKGLQRIHSGVRLDCSSATEAPLPARLLHSSSRPAQAQAAGVCITGAPGRFADLQTSKPAAQKPLQTSRPACLTKRRQLTTHGAATWSSPDQRASTRHTPAAAACWHSAVTCTYPTTPHKYTHGQPPPSTLCYLHYSKQHCWAVFLGSTEPL
jgi:hypothetical protein